MIGGVKTEDQASCILRESVLTCEMVNVVSTEFNLPVISVGCAASSVGDAVTDDGERA